MAENGFLEKNKCMVFRECYEHGKRESGGVSRRVIRNRPLYKKGLESIHLLVCVWKLCGLEFENWGKNYKILTFSFYRG